MCTHIRLFICVDFSAFVVLVDFKQNICKAYVFFKYLKNICTQSKPRLFGYIVVVLISRKFEERMCFSNI